VARFYPARSWENPAATVDQFVTAVLTKAISAPMWWRKWPHTKPPARNSQTG